MGGILDSRAGTTRDPAGHVLGYWDRAIVDEEWKLRTVFPSGPQSNLGDGTCELYRHERSGPRDSQAYQADSLDVEEAAAAAERLRKFEERLLP